MVSSLTQSHSDKLTSILHTCAHIMAIAVQQLYPGTKVAIGLVTETGLYYDFDCP
ncbi:hypothetical protein [Nostoc sp. CENA543]|uniref:hypothetical protein n=1 Tax=Nostoc sp. CENA543 TaxID=1869241 RepID=UPI0012FFD9D0|nr:hypothetical protein [Nostoc sp. CENA543]